MPGFGRSVTRCLMMPVSTLRTARQMADLTATYSPDDNKLRLYAATRLNADTYARVKAAGFIWAPKQDLFVAPMWTPDREDLLLELAGQIDDEDTSLTDRAEARADRFTDYHERRTDDAEAAQKTVAAIAGGIPMGQPILVGHHSERHARRDAERIENGMRKAIRMWDTAQYWKARAAGAIRHARYKELPAVRARRIKTIEADKRKQEKYTAEASQWIKAWSQLNDPYKDGRPCDDALRLKRATWIANYSHVSLAATAERPHGDSLWSALDGGRVTPRAAMLIALKVHGRTIKHARRWIAHLDHRLDYERAMLAESGGLITDRTEYPIVPGGRVLIGSEWLTVIRVNRTAGRICSVTTNARYVRVRGIETVKDYQPPTTEAAAAAKAAKTLPPLVNFDSPDAIKMPTAEYQQAHRDYRFTRTIAANAAHGAYRRRFKMRGGTYAPVFLTDAKVTPPPSPDDSPSPPPLPPPDRVPSVVDRQDIGKITGPTQNSTTYGDTDPRPSTSPAESFEAMRDTLRAGVQVVAAPQLFPTPADVARQLIDLAELEPGQTLLEPSAGTGALLDAVREAGIAAVQTIIEIDYRLAERLRQRYDGVRQADFLQCDDLGTFDRILMNPPFKDGADIRHILHARGMLAPGGRLTAVCANGPRQHAQLRPLAGTWIELPAETFAGTAVRAAILTIDAEPAPAADLLEIAESGHDHARHG